jgi:hypothetical protein
MARRYWSEKFPYKDLSDFEELKVPLKWIDGPDLLKVRYGDREPEPYPNCFVTVTGKDFGIEIDRIAKINIDRGAVLVDGEFQRDLAVNAPVGLFEVGRLNDELTGGVNEFVPDVLFYDGQRRDGKELENIVHRRYLPEVEVLLGADEVVAFNDAPAKYDLCPVTRRLVERYMQLAEKHVEPPPKKCEDCEVFISFAREDEKLARRVYDVVKRTGHRAFFSEESWHHPNFSVAIDNALDEANCLIAVGSDPAHLKKGWVEYEWRSFHNDILNGWKPVQAKLFAVFAGFEPRDIPRPLRQSAALKCDPAAPDRDLERLPSMIP